MTKRYPLDALEAKERRRDVKEIIGFIIVTVVVIIVCVLTDGGKEAKASGVADPFGHFNETWTTLPPDVIDVLTESGRPNADSRRWERCAIHWGSQTSRIICPGGYTTRY